MRGALLIVSLAALVTGLNALKPLHIDDATFYFNAAQIAAHPSDPYGYVMLRWDDAIPALHALAPPGLPYWWAAMIRLFGEQPVCWKLWLFPFVLLFVASLSTLLRRFAPSVATPLLILLVLSPVFLPSLNLMMDLPALSLSLTALVLFLRACDRESLSLALLAGVAAGMGMQTKYTGFLAPAVLLLYALLHRKMMLCLAAAVTAALLFASWETGLFLRYGESHFVYQLFHGDNGDQPKRMLLGAIFPVLGGAIPTLAVLALTVLRASRWLLVSAVLFVLLPYFLLICADTIGLGANASNVAAALFAVTGGGVLLGTAAAAWRLRFGERQMKSGALVEGGLAESRSSSAPSSPRTDTFLILWLILEIVGYVAISPFPAVRRIMGVTVAATILLGRLADRTALELWQQHLLRALAAVTALLGFGFFAVDFLEAWAEQQAVYEAARLIRQEQPNAVIWYAGYWGFQYYAEESGMKQIVPRPNSEDEKPALLPATRFHRGDWLVIPDEDIPQQTLDLERAELEPKCEIVMNDRIPLSTVMNYYAGVLPLRHRDNLRITVRLFHVKDDFLAR
jgi:hypothetical protein